jgi:hypothetical protein
MFERGDRGLTKAGIDQIFGQGADDTVASCVNLANLARMLARSFNTPQEADNRANTARLRRTRSYGPTTPKE